MSLQASTIKPQLVLKTEEVREISDEDVKRNDLGSDENGSVLCVEVVLWLSKIMMIGRNSSGKGLFTKLPLIFFHFKRFSDV